MSGTRRKRGNGSRVRGEGRIRVANRQRRVRIATRPYHELLDRLVTSTGRSPAEVGLTFVSDRRMHRLNREYRGINRSTDVLAFPAANVSACHRQRQAQVRGRSASSPPDNPHRSTGPIDVRNGPLLVLGDIVISAETAKRQARSSGHTVRAECTRLLIHGYLHLLGYDHERSRPQARRMRRMERQLYTRVTRHHRA